MRMELRLHPADAARVAQARRSLSPPLSRSRSRRVWTVLHDTSDRALTRAGHALLEQRGRWRIERLWPNGALWPPAAPAPVLDEASTRPGLTMPLPDAIAPVAMLEGMETSHALMIGHEPVTLVLWNGAVRPLRPGASTSGAAARHRTHQRAAPPPVPPTDPATDPARPPRTDAPSADGPSGDIPRPAEDLRLCRVLIEGPERAVRTVAIHLATTLRAEAPRAGFVAEALWLLSPAAIPPKRTGPPVLPNDADPPLTTGAAFRHILGHLVDVMLHLAPAATDGAAGTEPVHQMRVAVRRARSAITVFHPAIDGPDLRTAKAHLKDLSARLGPTRDWDVFVTETLREVTTAIPDNRPLARLGQAAEATRRTAQTVLGSYLTAPAFRVLGVELAWLAGAGSWLPASPPAASTSPPAAPSPAASPPSGLSPSGLSPSGLSPSGLSPSGLPPSGLPPSGLPPSGLSARGSAPPPDGAALTDFARAVLQKRWKKLRNAGRSIDHLDVPALHALRLRAKRARYAAEVFVSLYSGRRPARLIRRISRLQEHLGVLNDGAVAAHLLEQLGGARGRHAHAIGLVLGFAAARAATVRPRVLRAWKKFHRAERFWG